MDLIKGILDYEGLGPYKKWVIITKKGEHKNIWSEFCEALYKRSTRLKVQFGEDHIIIKGREEWEDGKIIKNEQLNNFLRGIKFNDSYIENMIFHLDLTLKLLNGRHVRMKPFYGSFSIMSTDFFNHLKSIEKSYIVGRYLDSYGYCYVQPRPRREICRFEKEDQCIFAVSLFKKGVRGIYITDCLCGKYVKNFSSEQTKLFENGKLGKMRKVENCEPPRGYEF